MLSLAEAGRRVWDALVVGAGPAGATAARQMASRGAAVLLVDKASFPRPKICGCCLNAAALGTLREIGLGDLPKRLGARPVWELKLAVGGRRASIPLPEGSALSRERLDAALVDEAIRAGAVFLPRTEAALDGVKAGARHLLLRQGKHQEKAQARVVLAADGVGGSLLQSETGIHRRVARDSRIGVGAITEHTPDDYAPGKIFMACGRNGYAGLVRLEDGRLNIAAAFDPGFVRRAGGPGQAVEQTLREAALPRIEGLDLLCWRGTPALTTRRSPLSAERLFLLGDAAGYVEPFTGEGISWALASGKAVAPLALEAIQRWEPSLAPRWAREHRRLIGQRQFVCRITAKFLRRRALTRAAVALLSWVPWASAPMVRHVNREMAWQRI